MNNLTFIFKEIIYLGGTASILIITILIIKKLFNKVLSPKWHYYIWILLFIRLMVPIYPESSMSIYNLFYTVAEKINLPISQINLSFRGNSLTDNPDYSVTTSPTGATNVNIENSTKSGDAYSITDTSFNVTAMKRYDSIITILALVWLIGVLLLTLYTACINIIFAINVRRTYTPLRDGRISRILEVCKNTMKITRSIPLLTSTNMKAPSLYGLLYTKILISESYMNQLSDDEIRYIFLHELCHYKRKDIAINWILAILQIIYFFNPLIWYAFYKIHEDCEISCDAAALKYVNEAEYQSYGSTIIKLIKLLSESSFIPITAGISKNKSSYKRRIIMISKFKKSNWASTFLALLLITSVGLIGLTGCKLSTATNSNNSNINTSNPIENIATSPNYNKEIYYGEWVIQQVLAYGQVGTYSTEDAESLLGKSLDFSEDAANYFGDNPSDIDKVATNPVYKKTVISKSDFITYYRMSFDKLGLKADSVSEITVSDSKGNNISTFFIKDDNTLILYGGGTYFELTRKTA